MIMGVIPDEIGIGVKFGETILYQGKELVVVENNARNGQLGTINFVPADYICVDC